MDRPITYPDFVARFYDVVYHQIRSSADRQYFVQMMQQARGPVLEVGVGTGRLFLEALKRNVDVFGIDVNESMLGQLRGKLSPTHHHRVSLQDVRTMDLGRRFDLIVAPFRVFAHLISVEDQLSALERVAAHLDRGGTFIFDLFVPDLRRLAEGLEDAPDFDGEHEPGKKLRRFVSMKNDPIRQVSLVSMRFVWEDGPETLTRTWQFPFRYFFRFELEHLVHRSALELVTIHGDYHESPLGEGSKDFVVVCRLPG